jgi:hypothetical protein
MAQEVTDPFGEPPSSAAKPQVEGDAPTPVFYAEEQSLHVDKIRTVLREPLHDGGLEFQDTALSEVVDFLRTEYGIEIQLDLESLKQIERSPEDPISANLRNISVGSALRLMLPQLDLTYFISDEVLIICAEEEAVTRLVVAVYPVGDILAIKEGYESAVEENNGKTKKPGVEDMDGLIDVIISTVAPDSWLENGGPEADIRPLQPGLLVISQTADVHERIQHLLAALRQAKQHACAVPHRASPEVTGFHGGMSGPMPQVGEAPREAVPSQQEQGGGMF